MVHETICQEPDFRDKSKWERDLVQYEFTETDYIEQQRKLSLDITQDKKMCCNMKWCPSGKCGKKLIKIASVFKWHKSLWKCTKCSRYFIRQRDPSISHGNQRKDTAGISTSPIGELPQAQGSLGNEESKPLSETAPQLR